MLGSILRGLAGLVKAVLGGLTDGPLSIARGRALYRHSPALVFYQGCVVSSPLHQPVHDREQGRHHRHLLVVRPRRSF